MRQYIKIILIRGWYKNKIFTFLDESKKSMHLFCLIAPLNTLFKVFLDHEKFFFSNLGNKIHSFLWNSHPLNFSEFKRKKVTHGHLLRKKNVASKRFSLNCKLCLTFYCSKNAFTGELTLVNWIAFASFLHCNFASICALNW